jgi:hypothetical protein
MTKLIAGLVALSQVAVVVDGERQVVAVGEVLPDTHPHDARELIAAGVVQDPKEVERQRRAQARDDAQAQASLEQTRRSIEQAMESQGAPGAPGAQDESAGGSAKSAKR